MLRIVRAEDERRWDKDLSSLLTDKTLAVRRRAALAAGRIGDEDAVLPLVSLLQSDHENDVRAMAAFALGEIESASAADALMAELAKQNPSMSRARVVEALGKIAAALPPTEEGRKRTIGKTILEILDSEAHTPAGGSGPDTEVILLGLTAALRARPEGAGKIVAKFLSYSDPRLRADAANTLARLRANDGNAPLRKLLTSDPDPIVRANAARVLGATEDKTAFEGLLDRAVKDPDSRVRMSAIRALGGLKDTRAGAPFLERGEQLLVAFRDPRAEEVNEIVEIATSIGRVLANSKNDRAVRWLRQLRSKLQLASPEVEVAFARVAPHLYQIEAHGSLTPPIFSDPNAVPNDLPVVANTKWQSWASIGQGLAELAAIKSDSPIADAGVRGATVDILRNSLSCPQFSTPREFKPKAGDTVGVKCRPLPLEALPDFLRAFAAFKPQDLEEVLRGYLKHADVIIRATAAELLSELPLDEVNTRAFSEALPVALRDKRLNDAALAILDALGKQKSASANDVIKSALGASDPSIRSRAVSLLKTNGAGDFSVRVGKVQTRNTTADHQRCDFADWSVRAGDGLDRERLIHD